MPTKQQIYDVLDSLRAERTRVTQENIRRKSKIVNSISVLANVMNV